MIITRSTTSVFLFAWLWTTVILAAMETTEAWISSTTILPQRISKPNLGISTTTPRPSPTVLFGKKKKGSGGGGGVGSATKGAAKIQVKLLQHIAGTGQAGDVILVNPVFFANKLRPQKLARVITDEEVQVDQEKKQSQSDALLKQAKALQELLDDNDDDESSCVLVFRDNQTGPDGKKLFGGIGPKKLMDSLRKDCQEFDAFSKEFTKQVSILDVEVQETVIEEEASEPSNSKYTDYSSPSKSSSDQPPPKSTVKYSSLPKKDKLTIKETGVFRVKVALTKDLFAKVKVVVE